MQGNLLPCFSDQMIPILSGAKLANPPFQLYIAVPGPLLEWFEIDDQSKEPNIDSKII